jgi:hypothetical protein
VPIVGSRDIGGQLADHLSSLGRLDSRRFHEPCGDPPRRDSGVVRTAD